MAKTKNRIVGRQKELRALKKALSLSRNVLIEGPVGVGKTFLVREVLQELDRDFERIDGDTRYTESKLTGWFDPPLVLKKGYTASCFIDGPLASAMKRGKVLFINELNRMPEAVQNILLPAMDERHITIPKLGRIDAKPGFLVVATQNPREFTATHAVSEALLDRFEMLPLHYQSREEELQIVSTQIQGKAPAELLQRAVDIVRATRNHPSIKRGASIRAALAIISLVTGGMDLEEACLMALPSRIEMISSDEDALQTIRELVSSDTFSEFKEKKSLQKSLRS
ncbi:MAG: MoxR family ATPase [Proteobacteria bacterium]|nr:MoxR family ATPase [Pseudomonadota bacterium]